MTTLAEIRPTSRNLIINLVRDAGIDVSNWKNFRTGDNELRAAANPKYCYEWAFIEPKKVVAINFWYAELRNENGQITQAYNYREIANKPGQKSIWKKRAQTVDDAIRYACDEGLPIRAIICDGNMRNLDDKASRVTKRRLDEKLWAVTEYDYHTGRCVITRGVEASRLKDQFSLPDYESTVTEKISRTGEVFVRRPEIRRIALNRANGSCEYCSMQGFVMMDGSIFLETHHIIPLSEGGTDTPENVASLCPNHHREAHLGKCSQYIREHLLSLRKSENP